MQICAIDCASDENNDVCRQYEVMRYPTMRYFPPLYASGPKQLGTNLDHLLMPQIDELVDELTKHIVNETVDSPGWPNFESYQGKDWSKIFDNAALDTKHVFLVSESLPGFLAQQVVLDQSGVENIDVRLIDPNDTRVSTGGNFKLGVVDKKGIFQNIPTLNDSRSAFDAAIVNHLKQHHILVVTSAIPPFFDSDNSTDNVGSLLDRFYYDKSRLANHLYRSDLEQAIRYTLNHEVIQHETIDGEKLQALRNFVSVLSRYYNYGNKISFRKLLDYLMEPSRTEVRGKDFQTILQQLDPKIIREGRYVGCFSTQRGLRRFPCSLWSLFHHLTVQHLESEYNDDPMEVLQAMHGYVKHFFGCTDCSKHFQEMARRNHIWNVTSKDQAVLWLWSGHNEVNQRLAGDVTEDKNHPKVQYPIEEHCQSCRKKNGEWDKTEVLEFFRKHYSNDYVSDLGVDDIPRSLMLNARARQIFSGSGDTHLHVGILAYVVIIVCLMVAAVRFYFRRGYRKKLYTHDILGKV